MLERLPALAAADPWFARRGRHINVDMLVGVGLEEWLVRIRGGAVEVEKGPFVTRPWTFAIRAGSDAWASFWQPVPPPQRNDIFALMKHHLLSLEGDLHPFFAHVLWFKALLALPRQHGAASQGAGQHAPDEHGAPAQELRP